MDKKNIDKINKYLTNINLPEYESDQHREKLRLKVLNENQGSKVMPNTNKLWKAAAVIVLIASLGAIATAVTMKIYKYSYDGRDRDGTYHFTTETTSQNENGETNVSRREITISMSPRFSEGSKGSNFSIDVDKQLKALEEVDYLRQNDIRELASVVEKYVNGNFNRTLNFDYTLSDGNVMNLGEGDPDIGIARNHEKDQQEIDALREIDQRKLAKVTETGVDDKLSRTCVYQYTLSDGYKTMAGEHDPETEEFESLLSAQQIEELENLRRLKDGQYLGYENIELEGKTFESETYIYTLSDGTEVYQSTSTPTGKDKIELTGRDWEEFRELRTSKAGQQLESEVKEIRGKMFSFERQLYILNDGTEIIWSLGYPVEDK